MKILEKQQLDDLFIDYPSEWYEGMAMSSAHDAASIDPFDLANSYVLFCYPRDFTPVCTQELNDLIYHRRDFPCELIAASTDSPEVHNAFFNEQKTFSTHINYPVLSISDKNLTDKGRSLILNEYGYCRRVAIIVVRGFIKGLYETDEDTARDIDLLLKLTKKIITN